MDDSAIKLAPGPMTASGLLLWHPGQPSPPRITKQTISAVTDWLPSVVSRNLGLWVVFGIFSASAERALLG